MSQVLVLFNPLSGNGCGKENLQTIKDFFKDRTVVFQDITAIEDMGDYMGNLQADTCLVICGGDGTLNRFINSVPRTDRLCDTYYYPTGSGNDFLRDLGKIAEDGPVKINQYIQNLPEVSVNGKTYRFLNGVGYGIDGYCCEVGEQLRAAGKKPDYTAIAIKGLLFHYKPTNAVVTVDGVKHTYRKVWIAPTMYGRYYGGGMMAAPDQNRDHNDGLLSLLLMHKAGRIGTLCVFPSIFKGEHIKHSKTVALHRGREITVEFDRPVTLQIDGEVVKNVTRYRAYQPVPVKR